MNITSVGRGDVTVATVTGKLDTNTCSGVEEHLSQLITEGARKIAVDFGDLDFISSAGLRVLLSCAKQLTASDGELRIFGLNDVVTEVFEISGFSTIFKVFESEEQALAGF